MRKIRQKLYPQKFKLNRQKTPLEMTKNRHKITKKAEEKIENQRQCINMG